MKIDYLTGSRADFGLMLPCLEALHLADDFILRIVVTGQHLTPKYGDTVRDIERSGLDIAKRIPVALTGADGAEMALAFSAELEGLTRFWAKNPPDAVMLLGDRGEMLAGALAAMHLGIPIIHVGGGERSGTLDESFRHAITKLAHIHLSTSAQSAERISRMGEDSEQIHVIGAPGLIGIQRKAAIEIDFVQDFGLRPGQRVAMVIYHPVVQEAVKSAEQARAVIAAVRDSGYSQLILRPNSDAGGVLIDKVLDESERCEDVTVVDHLSREVYLSAMRSADLLVGNSSSGIIESASLKTKCLNIGSRQHARERNTNTVDCPNFDLKSLRFAIAQAERIEPDGHNVYGNGDADLLMLEALRKTRLGPELLAKSNSY